jgi:AraC-like DNA-binding protein
MSPLLPVSTFATDVVSPEKQFAAWRESIAPLFDAAPARHAEPRSFQGEYETYMAGPLALGGTAFEAHRYGRSAQRIRSDGLNHYHVNLHLAGGFSGRVGERDFSAGPGDITLLDFGKPVELHSLPSELLVIGVPREALEFNIPRGEHHGLVLRGVTGLGGLLGDHMRSLVARLPQMTVDEVPAATAASIAMIAACFQPTAATFAEAKSTLLDSIGDRLRRHIALNLRAGALAPDELCAEFGISRASLYRVFTPYGGVAAYIQNQRLSHVFTALMNPMHKHRKISDLAFEWGFVSEPHFSRTFRKAFGMSPSDARSVNDRPDDLQEWVPRLRRR